MSRRVVREDDAFSVVVGWDPPLRTFFVQVYDIAAFQAALQRDPDADDVIVLWEGFAPDEIAAPQDVAERVAPWAALSEDDLAGLARDKMLGL